MDAVVAAVLSELEGIFCNNIKTKGCTKRLFLVNHVFTLPSPIWLGKSLHCGPSWQATWRWWVPSVALSCQRLAQMAVKKKIGGELLSFILKGQGISKCFRCARYQMEMWNKSHATKMQHVRLLSSYEMHGIRKQFHKCEVFLEFFLFFFNGISLFNSNWYSGQVCSTKEASAVSEL